MKLNGNIPCPLRMTYLNFRGQRSNIKVTVGRRDGECTSTLGRQSLSSSLSYFLLWFRVRLIWLLDRLSANVCLIFYIVSLCVILATD